MVKRGIGAVVLAIIAALLLGYLLKDKSRAREDIVDMKLPGAPEITIPSLSDATSKITDSAASLVGEAKDSVSNAGNAVAENAVIDSASSVVTKVTDSVSNTSTTVIDSASASTETVIANVTTSSDSASNNPGFSFRPPNKNEEQQINTDSSADNSSNNSSNDNSETRIETNTNNTVVASTPKTEIKPAKVFKPTIENEPKKIVKKKAVVKKAVAKKAIAKKQTVKKAVAKTKPATSTSSKFAIQLLATSSQSRANKLAKTMNAEGYASFITQTSSNNKILYRVRVGGHKDRATALKAQQGMKRRYLKNFSVQNSLVVSQ